MYSMKMPVFETIVYRRGSRGEPLRCFRTDGLRGSVEVQEGNLCGAFAPMDFVARLRFTRRPPRNATRPEEE